MASLFETEKFARKYKGLGDRNIAPSEQFVLRLLVELAEAIHQDVKYLNDYKVKSEATLEQGEEANEV